MCHVPLIVSLHTAHGFWRPEGCFALPSNTMLRAAEMHG